jgi:hypothetical protein
VSPGKSPQADLHQYIGSLSRSDKLGIARSGIDREVRIQGVATPEAPPFPSDVVHHPAHAGARGSTPARLSLFHGSARFSMEGRLDETRTCFLAVMSMGAPSPVQDRSDFPDAVPGDIAKRGEAHLRLDPLVGEWETAIKIWDGPDRQEPMELRGRVRREWVLGAGAGDGPTGSSARAPGTG